MSMKYLRFEEKKALEHFVDSTLRNLRKNVKTILLHGSSIFRKNHEDVDVVVITYGDRVERDPYTGADATILTDIGAYGDLEPVKSQVLHNAVDISGVKIDYVVIPHGLISRTGTVFERGKSLDNNKPVNTFMIFMNRLLEENIPLYEDKK